MFFPEIENEDGRVQESWFMLLGRMCEYISKSEPVNFIPNEGKWGLYYVSYIHSTSVCPCISQLLLILHSNQHPPHIERDMCCVYKLLLLLHFVTIHIFLDRTINSIYFLSIDKVHKASWWWLLNESFEIVVKPIV